MRPTLWIPSAALALALAGCDLALSARIGNAPEIPERGAPFPYTDSQQERPAPCTPLKPSRSCAPSSTAGAD